MRAHRIEKLGWIVSFTMLFLAWLGWQRASVRADVERDSRPRGSAAALPVQDSVSLHVAVERIVGRDPFRLDRRPADVRFNPDPPGQTPPATAPPPVPVPVLRGVTGPPWLAVLENVPGHARAVVARVGSVFGTLVVSSIAPDTVIVETPDTTFTLTVRRAWR